MIRWAATGVRRLRAGGFISGCYLFCVFSALQGGHAAASDPPREKARNLSDLKKFLAGQGAGGRSWSPESQTCGVDCLYLFLKAQGVACSLPEVEQLVPVGEYGSSLLDLRQASERLGSRARIVRTAPENVAELPRPAIAHFEARQKSSRFNHYVLVVDAGASFVTVIDPLTNQRHRMELSQFAQASSGHYLVPDSRWFDSQATVLFVAVGLAFTGAGLWWARSRRKGGA